MTPTHRPPNTEDKNCLLFPFQKIDEYCKNAKFLPYKIGMVNRLIHTNNMLNLIAGIKIIVALAFQMNGR